MDKNKIQQAIAEVEDIYQKTMLKLDDLHRQKVNLIKLYKQRQEEEEMEKIKRNIF